MFALLGGCGKTADQERTARQKDATQKELDVQAEGENNLEERAKIRKASTDYVQANLHGGNVQGVSMFDYSGNLFLVGVDVKLGDKRQTYNLITRLFISADGQTYWKAEPFTPNLADTLSGHALLQYRADVEYAKVKAKEEKERQEKGDDN